MRRLQNSPAREFISSIFFTYMQQRLPNTKTDQLGGDCLLPLSVICGTMWGNAGTWIGARYVNRALDIRGGPELDKFSGDNKNIPRTRYRRQPLPLLCISFIAYRHQHDAPQFCYCELNTLTETPNVKADKKHLSFLLLCCFYFSWMPGRFICVTVPQTFQRSFRRRANLQYYNICPSILFSHQESTAAMHVPESKRRIQQNSKIK